jgi:DNA-binding XRE family transcriptional regulator
MSLGPCGRPVDPAELGRGLCAWHAQNRRRIVRRPLRPARTVDPVEPIDFATRDAAEGDWSRQGGLTFWVPAPDPDDAARAAFLDWRLERGMSQELVGEGLGIPQTTVSKLERGVALPTEFLARRIARIAGIPVSAWPNLRSTTEAA